MGVLSELKPGKVFRFFEEICSIPHGSFETKAISDYLVAFAKERGLQYRQDEANNVIIRKAATRGYESSPVVMIQGHIDMVCEKEPGCTKNMQTEGLELFIDDDTVGARGTTLGGDDGIAVAMALAILDSDDIPHAELECLFTADEEVGMIGARALDVSDLKAKYLLNIDSETEKVLTVSCAGSARVHCSFSGSREAFNGSVMELTVSGLVGGHSGEEIHKCRANSNILLGRFLDGISQATPLRIISVTGGAKDNAIPVSSGALICVEDCGKAAFAVERLAAELKNEYKTPDPHIKASLIPACSELLPLSEKITGSVICFMFCVPNGVQNMSADVAGLVQTSLNLGRVYTDGDSIVFSMMLRSSIDSQKDEVLNKIKALCSCLGGSVDVASSYSAWEYRPQSRLREITIDAFNYVYGTQPSVAALHAGLECGILSGKIPELDCISFGPDLTDIHTPRERLHIASTRRVWHLMLETLKRLK